MGTDGVDDRDRIRVTNFDPLQQAQVWLSRGPEKATRVLTAMLRTAILLGEELVIDRNDLLDGIYFLSLGPEGIAHSLGLTTGATLPITLLCEPCEPQDLPDAPSVTPCTELERMLDLQLRTVSAPAYARASSAFGALIGTEPRDPTGSTSGREWLFPTPGPSWFPGAGFTDPYHPISSERKAGDAIAVAREGWRQAASHGRLKATPWKKWSPVSEYTVSHPSMEDALDIQRRTIISSCGPHEKPARHVKELLTMTSTSRKAALARIDNLAEGDGPGIDGVERRLLLETWSRPYNQALAWKDDCYLLSFQIAAAGSIGDGVGLPRLRQYGLAPAEETRWRRMLRRRARLSRDVGVAVEGEILDHMEAASPGSFAEMARATEPVITAMQKRQDLKPMLNLALTSRRRFDQGRTHAETMRASLLRGVAISSALLLITAMTLLKDAPNRPEWAPLPLLAATTVLSILAGLPWSDILDVMSMRPSSMSATLSLKGARNR